MMSCNLTSKSMTLLGDIFVNPNTTVTQCICTSNFMLDMIYSNVMCPLKKHNEHDRLEVDSEVGYLWHKHEELSLDPSS